MKDLYKKESLLKINSLSDNELKSLIKDNLINSEKILLSDELDVTFIKKWNQFVKTGELCKSIIDSYFTDIKVRISKLLIDENWALKSYLLHDGLNHECVKTGLSVGVLLDEDFIPSDKYYYSLILNEKNLKNYEITKLFCKENIDDIVNIHEESRKRNPKNSVLHCNNLIKSVKNFLMKLDKKKLPLFNVYDYDVPFFNAWNNFVKGSLDLNDDSWYELAIPISDAIYMTKLSIQNNIPKLSLNPSFSGMNNQCRKTGNKFSFNFNKDFTWNVLQWKPRTITRNGKKIPWGKLVPIEENLFKNKIYSKKIEFKTGNLIFCDWFRFDSLENAIIKSKYSINSTKGVVDSVKDLLKKYNMISIPVGNTSPYVYLDNDNIIVGEGLSEESKGYVITDVWKVSIIEEEQLLNILNKFIDFDSANKLINELKKDCLTLKVKKGRYKLNFMGDYREFEKEYRKRNKKLSKNYIPYFTLDKIIDM